MNMPAIAAETPKHNYRVDQADYLTYNWKMLQASDDSAPFAKYIRVLGGTASLSNGDVILRTPLLEVPDGCYVLTINNELIPSDPTIEMSWRKFPDYELVKPNFERMSVSPPFVREEMAKFVEFLGYVRQESRNSNAELHLYKDYAAVVDTELGYKFPFQIPLNPAGVVLDVYSLKLVFTEMLRYDHVRIGSDLAKAHAPMFVGLDWAHCAISTVKLRNSRYW